MLFDKTILGSFLHLRHIRCKRCCLQGLDSLQSYSRSAKEKNKQDIKSWVENSLHDPVPALYHPSVLNTGMTLQKKKSVKYIIPPDEFKRQWQTKFQGGEPMVVDQVIQKKNVDNVLFSIQKLVPLILSLRYLQRYCDIDKIYQTYKSDLVFLKNSCPPEIYSRFIKLILQAEFRLKNYQLCEELFSEYIKYPKIQPNMIDVGLVTFVKNRNYPLAKEFYNQVLKNQETFPIKPSGLHAFAFEIYKTSDFSVLKKVFDTWLENTEGPDQLPLKETIVLMHRLFLKFEDREGLATFLSQEKIHRTGYEESLDFELCELYHELLTNDEISGDVFKEKISHFIPKLKEDDRKKFYLNILGTAVSRNDFKLVKYITAKSVEAGAIDFTHDYHKQILNYFVRNGQLRNLVQYFRDVIIPTPGFHLNQAFLEQLWNCALQNYPILTREITNDLRVILNQKVNIREFYWLDYTLKNKIVLMPKESTALNSGNNLYCKVKFHSLNPKIINAIQRCLRNGDVATAYSILTEQVRHGLRPDFAVFYSFLKLFMKTSVDLAKSLDQLLRDAYHKVPLKVDVLWLKHNTIQTVDSIKCSIFTLRKRQEALVVTRTKIKNFEEEHRNNMNLQNYMQISSLFLDLRDPKSALQHIQRGRKLVNESNRLDWFIYYSTALKVYTRARNPEGFLEILSEWNRNSQAWLITPSIIRSCKGYVNYLVKTQKSKDADTEVIEVIRSELDSLLSRYTNYKFQGLNDMKMLSTFLKDWIKRDLAERDKIAVIKRKELLSGERSPEC